MVVKVNMQLHHSFYECGRTQYYKYRFKSQYGFFLEWR